MDSANDERENRIVATAVALAEDGGFEAVRLRDVAAQAEVALGTLYRHFRSKDDLLVAALTREARGLERRMKRRPLEGATALERVMAHFGAVTRAMFRRPNFTRAVLRAASSDEPKLSEKLKAFHEVTGGGVVAALRADRSATLDEATDAERRVCEVLHGVWFAALIAWMSGQHTQAQVIERVECAAELVLRGAGLD